MRLYLTFSLLHWVSIYEHDGYKSGSCFAHVTEKMLLKVDGSTKIYNSCSVGNGKLFRFVDEIDVKPGRKDNRALPIMASMLFPRGAPQAWSPGIASPCIPLQDTLECSSLIRVCV